MSNHANDFVQRHGSNRDCRSEREVVRTHGPGDCVMMLLWNSKPKCAMMGYVTWLIHLLLGSHFPNAGTYKDKLCNP